jgi:hypothetical protein
LSRGELALFLADDVVSKVYAVCADVDIGRAFDHGSDVAGRFATEGAGGDASATESPAAAASGGKVGSSAGWQVRGTAAIAGAINVGHFVCLPVSGAAARFVRSSACLRYLSNNHWWGLDLLSSRRKRLQILPHLTRCPRESGKDKSNVGGPDKPLRGSSAVSSTKQKPNPNILTETFGFLGLSNSIEVWVLRLFWSL